jgi:hypothetical protein
VWKRLTFPSIFLGNEGKKRLDSKWELDMEYIMPAWYFLVKYRGGLKAREFHDQICILEWNLCLLSLFLAVLVLPSALTALVFLASYHESTSPCWVS